MAASQTRCSPADQFSCRVRYMHIFEDSVISLGIFQLPMGATIPLHDHPGMTVISRFALPQAVDSFQVKMSL